MERHLRIFAGALILLGGFLYSFAGAAYAQDTQSYFYDKISITAVVNPDSTVDITEEQQFNFTSGTFHKGFREIPLHKIGVITDIRVTDGTTGEPLKYSVRSLDKDEPESWGYYTYSRGNPLTVEWYYDAASPTTRTWIITYKVHGALSFLSDHDELYWNLFTDYTVPVRSVEARVVLPEPVTTPSAAMYTDPEIGTIVDRPDDRTFRFLTSNVPPEGKVTIAAGWQKGMVDARSFWRDWFAFNFGYVLGVLIALGATIALFVRWFFAEKFRKGKGTIIAEYEPPEHLPPAIAQVLVTGHMNNSTWPATIVDLAVRGFVKIVPEEKARMVSFLPVKKGYRVEKVKEYVNDTTVQTYEREFLDILFEKSNSFSTLELESAGDTAKTEMYKDMQKLRTTLLKETGDDTKAYEVTPERGQYFWALLLVACMALFLSFTFLPHIMPGEILGQCALLVATVVISVVSYKYLPRFNTRLSNRGFILRDDWKGFVLYLKTAEQLRLQNLTPELFEKYLPYAMVFKLEKQWARAFESMNLQPPQWYGGAGAYAYASGVTGDGGASSGFSPSVFSASFSSSLATAFASSGASGASGGGGGAGGGGGGGGGGAS